jgi:hypothetical protein
MQAEYHFSFKQLLWIILVALAFGIAAQAGYWYFANPERVDTTLSRQEKVNLNRISDTLAEAGVPYRDIARGFWYTYIDENGEEQVAFIDREALARQGLTEEQLLALLRKVNGAQITSRDSMQNVSEEDLPPELQFHNQLYVPGGVGSTVDFIAALEKKIASGTFSRDDLRELAYAYEQRGDYKKRDAVHELSCSTFPDTCAVATPIVIEGIVRDIAGNPVQGATVEIISRPGSPTVTTDSSGFYTLNTDINGLERFRIRATKRNFSDGIATLQTVTKDRTYYSAPDIVMANPVNVVTIDTENLTITGSGNLVLENGTFIARTGNSVYEIPPDAVVDSNGSPYQGEVDVYMYEFNADNVPESLISADVFDAVLGFTGDSMRTYGMPYIQFFTLEGEELYVLASNPLALTYTIPQIQDLYAASPEGLPPLTDADMQLLENVSAGGGYPIDREFLTRNGLLRFPAFWVFDHQTGVWDNVGINVVDKSGIIRSPFYTVKGVK